MPRWAPDAALRLERAAIELFRSQGYAATTVPQIAERAGLTTRTFFRHFPDKRDVLFLREREFPDVVADLLAAAPDGLDPMALAMHGLLAVTPELEAWRDAIRERRSIIATDPHLIERERSKSAVLAQAIRDGLARRGVDPVDAALISRTVAGLFDTALELWTADAGAATLASTVEDLHARLAIIARSRDDAAGASVDGVG
ncbi:TetR/AcrR family transcriptional regulator [Microbacterium sp. Yaish 1]|uniref:TetR/AcrR family transcriptional regulator n=1 Tax=Microbacterium sp. Yaish 1 TaxID=2025014 RepID=UPI000B9400F9|nr:TetR/AcrR family transcriptional regulator [Microbacterium sp. Yaish 1]OYC95191.1 hypothetical protein CI089_10590 [Microbacterium sp. Yaish 1]